MAVFDALNDTLNEYFNHVVQMKRKDTSDIIENVMSQVNRVIQRINELDPRFSADPVRVGSYYQKLKVNRADEFDLSIPLLYIGKLVPIGEYKPMRFGFVRKTDGMPMDESTPTAREDLLIVPKSTELSSPGVEYTTVQLSELSISRLYHDLMYEGFLIPYLVKIKLKKLLLQAVTDLDLRDAIDMARMLHGPAITVYIKHKDIENHLIRVNVDFAPIIPAQYSFHGATDWPDRGKQCPWLRTEDYDKIIDTGINFVAKKNFHWALSFAECEKALVFHMDADGGIRKKIHRIMKSFWREATNDGANSKLTTYMLKNAWLWECDTCRRSSDWAPDRITDRFGGSMRRPGEFVAAGSLPVYFNSQMNLLNGKSSEDIENMIKTVGMMRAMFRQFQSSLYP